MSLSNISIFKAWGALMSPKIQNSADHHCPPEIFDRLVAWAGSKELAGDWYLNYPIAALGGLTPEQLVSKGRVEDLVSYLKHIDEGGYA